ncbi:MAG: GGDEF domain-containing protein, partial [Clostridiales bacterium]|nr:GGDEF domain-containing protein [Clostridiales bacterium]
MKEKNPLNILIQKPQNYAICIFFCSISFFVYQFNYIFFHTMIEVLSLTLSIMMFLTATTTYKYSKSNFVLFVGISLLFVAILDAMHLMTYPGLGVFDITNVNVTAQFWTAARIVQILSLALASFFLNHSFSKYLIYWIYSIVTMGLIAVIMLYPLFPICYAKKTGFTNIKYLFEFLICLLAILTVFIYLKQKESQHQFLFQLCSLSLLFIVASEIAFIFYNPYNLISNFIGHLLKLSSFVLLFCGIFYLGVENPYRIISDQLKESATHDLLTGLYNRRGLEEFYPREIARTKRTGLCLGIIMIDLDNFKLVNDRYGHLAGDEILKQFAKILKSCVRETDLVCRIGGDEFLILANGNKEEIEAIQRHIVTTTDQEMIQKDQRLFDFGVSTGYATSDPGHPVPIDSLVLM